jgi:hypothetical protein
MKPEHYTSVVKLSAEMIDIREVIANLLSVTDSSMFEEVEIRLVFLKAELESLQVERNAFLDDV